MVWVLPKDELILLIIASEKRDYLREIRVLLLSQKLSEVKEKDEFGSLSRKMDQEGVLEWEDLGGIYKIWKGFGREKKVRNSKF